MVILLLCPPHGIYIHSSRLRFARNTGTPFAWGLELSKASYALVHVGRRKWTEEGFAHIPIAYCRPETLWLFLYRLLFRIFSPYVLIGPDSFALRELCYG